MLHDDVALEVNDERPGFPQDLGDLLGDLSFVRAPLSTVSGSRLTLLIRSSTRTNPALLGGRVVSQDDALEVREIGEDVYVSEGASLLHVRPQCGRATAQNRAFISTSALFSYASDSGRTGSSRSFARWDSTASMLRVWRHRRESTSSLSVLLDPGSRR